MTAPTRTVRRTRTAPRKARAPLGNRAVILLGLPLLLLVAVVVIWRRSIGVTTARDMRALEDQQQLLATQRTTLQREINDALSRSRIVSAAERRLGMHVASESETRALLRSEATITAPPRTP